MNETENKPVSVGDWILTIIVLALPLINIIMLFVWGFGGTTHPSKKSYCQAVLILFAIAIGLSILLGIIAMVFGLAIHPHTS